MSSMQEQLVRRYQRVLRELAASSSSRGAQPSRPAPGVADGLRPVPLRRRAVTGGASARARLRDLAQARYD